MRETAWHSWRQELKTGTIQPTDQWKPEIKITTLCQSLKITLPLREIISSLGNLFVGFNTPKGFEATPTHLTFKDNSPWALAEMAMGKWGIGAGGGRGQRSASPGEQKEHSLAGCVQDVGSFQTLLHLAKCTLAELFSSLDLSFPICEMDDFNCIISGSSTGYFFFIFIFFSKRILKFVKKIAYIVISPSDKLF